MKIIIGLWMAIGFSVLVWGQEVDDVNSPDLIIFNGKIVAMDDPSFSSDLGTISQALAVREDKILKLGTNSDILALAGPTTKKIDLGGRTVLPSFILTHEHPTDWAWSEPTVLNYVFPEGNEHLIVRFLKGNAEEQIASWEQVLREAVAVAKPNQWILLSSDFGANFENMPKLFTDFFRNISREKLDEIAPNNPVRVKNSFPDGLLNSRALEIVRKLFPEQSEEELDESGNLKGVGKERGMLSLIGRQLEPDIILHGKVDLNAKLLEAEMELWAAHGVTAYGSSTYTIGNLQAFVMLDLQSRMTGRLGWAYNGPDLHFQTLRFASALLGTGSDFLWNIGTQALAGGTCTTLAASEQVKKIEDCNFAPGTIGREWLNQIIRTGGRVATMHSVGDKDIDYLLDAIEDESKSAGFSLEEVRQRRHAFDHASGAPRPDQIPRIKRLGMMVSMINTVLWENRTAYDISYRVKNYGEEYAHYTVPRRSVTNAGIMNTMEIDRALPHFQFYNIWVGMTRYNEGCQRTFAPEESTDLATQLKALTTWGSYYMMKENRIGSLEPGKLADFIVLDRDILTVPIGDIPHLKVLMTVLGGKILHILPKFGDEINMAAVGVATWPTNPLETRFVFKGPPASCPLFQQ